MDEEVELFSIIWGKNKYHITDIINESLGDIWEPREAPRHPAHPPLPPRTGGDQERSVQLSVGQPPSPLY